MNKQWSELNKTMQDQFKREATFKDGISTLLKLRKQLMDVITALNENLDREDFNKMPFINHKGLENKSIAYSLYHTFRIEDIVSNTLIQKRDDIFLSKDYQKRMNSSIITTGNELVKEQIGEFSSQLNIKELYCYISEVYEDSNRMLNELTYKQTKQKMSEEDKMNLKKLCVVSEDENAVWLIDYWCNKNVKGLLQMPFSRHWIMHLEAVGRIVNKIGK